MRTAARVVAAACLLGCALLPAPASAAGDDFAHTTDQLVAALRQDPVLVQQTLGGGDTRGAHNRLAARVKKLPFPAYVALVEPPTDVQAGTDTARVLVATLHRKLAEPGLYVVQVAGSGLDVEAFGIDLDATLADLATTPATSAVARKIGAYGEDPRAAISPEGEAEIQLRTAADPGVNDYSSEDYENKVVLLSGATIDAIAREPWVRESRTTDFVDVDEPLAGKRFMVGTTAGLAVALVLRQTLRLTWPGWKPRPPEKRTPARTRKELRERSAPAATPPTPADVHREAETALTRLAERLAGLPAKSRHPEIVEDAVAAREAAEAFVDSTRATDVVGALVLARTGLKDLDRAARKKPGAAYRCCFFNPLHGAAATEATWEFGDAEIDAPVCRECSAALRGSGSPDVLLTRPGRKGVPYYEADDVWARTGCGSLVAHFGSVVLADRAERR